MFLTNIFFLLGQQSKGSVNVSGFALKLHAWTVTARTITLNHRGPGAKPGFWSWLSCPAAGKPGPHLWCSLLCDLGQALESLSLGFLTSQILVQPSHFIKSFILT